MAGGYAGLYWSRLGEVACAAHAPAAGSSQWAADRWVEVPVAYHHRHRRDYQCQHCSASRTPLAPPRTMGARTE
jgi:hypothetical protein